MLEQNLSKFFIVFVFVVIFSLRYVYLYEDRIAQNYCFFHYLCRLLF